MGHDVRVHRYPLSLAGTALILLSGVAWWIGRERMDLVLTLVGLWGWVLAVCLGVAAAIALWRVRRAFLNASDGRQPAPLRGVEQHPMDGPARIPRPRLPLVGRPSVSWSTPPASARLIEHPGNWREILVPEERVRTAECARRVEVRDVLGLWRLSWRIVETVPVRVLPATGRLEAAELESCLASGDVLPHPFGPAEGDRVDARPYTPSDPARMILWKVYARSRELMVRTPEPARAPERAPLIYLVAGPDDGAAAATARVLAEGRLLREGAWLAADGTPEPVGDPEAALDAIAESAAFRDRGGRHLQSAVEAAQRRGLDGVVLVCPARPGPWREVVEAVVTSQGCGPVLLLAAGDAAPPRPERARWQRALLQAPVASGPTFREMVAWASRWESLGVRTVVADRRSGRLQPLSSQPLSTPREETA